MLNNKISKNHKGQSLLYVSFLIVILISGVFFVYDIGNMVNTKIKFQNGADAAVLSTVALKITKHHTDQMIRTSMYHESVAAQSEQRAAQALLVQIVLSIKSTPTDVVTPPLPGGGGINVSSLKAGPSNVVQPTQPVMPNQEQVDLAKKYKVFVNKTYRHVIKLHRERKALESYYQWLANDQTGITLDAATEVARLGLRANTLGLITAKNPGLAENLKILADKKDLLENNRVFDNNNISGVAYANENGSIVGTFGKSFVQFDGNGASTNQGASLLKYFNKYTMTTNAAARIVSSDELNMAKTPIGVSGIPFEMLWYSPRLMAIEKFTDKRTVH